MKDAFNFCHHKHFFISKSPVEDFSKKEFIVIIAEDAQEEDDRSGKRGNQTGKGTTVVMDRSTSSSFSNAVLIISPMVNCHSEFFFLGLQ